MKDDKGLYVYMIWDYKENDWTTVYASKGAKSIWSTPGGAKNALNRRYGKDKWKERYDVIKCRVVPEPTDLQTLRAL